uniref:Putative secreted protein n=1 Tax=Anopheles triannulatus TaxID=58253 RepID=A0A2M4B3U4_9DIPT
MVLPPVLLLLPAPPIGGRVGFVWFTDFGSIIGCLVGSGPTREECECCEATDGGISWVSECVEEWVEGGGTVMPTPGCHGGTVTAPVVPPPGFVARNGTCALLPDIGPLLWVFVPFPLLCRFM